MKILIPLTAILLLVSCATEPDLDMIIYNANIYTVTDSPNSYTAIAVQGDKIAALGGDELKERAGETTEMIDAKGQFLMPGLIEGHGHFEGVGRSLINLNFLNSRSWEEITAMVKEAAANTPKGEWIEGRGWHQEKWDSIPFNNIHSYPMHHELSKISPDHPVILRHASGHSLFANEAAMRIAGVNKEMPNPAGGEIVRDKDGEAIGVFEERAMSVIYNALAEYKDGLNQEELEREWHRAIELAEQECVENGITSFQDAG